jgi:predicted transposase/invertase (TIGR01784 family)
MSEHWIDRNWKDIIKKNPDDAISYFMPELAAERDYSREPRFAGTEYPAIGGKSDKDATNPDLCMAVPLKTGHTPRALFLIEQQHEEDESLPSRIFKSWYRASDEHQIPVTSLAIYTGRAKPVNTYSSAWQGTSVNFTYNIYSVAAVSAEELKRDGRDFAIPLLAAKRMLEANGDPLKRGKYALELLDLIKERELEEAKLRSFRKFTSNILQLGEVDIDPNVREAWKMKWMSWAETVKEIDIRDAREEGMEEGMEKGMEKGAENCKLEVARSMRAEGLSAEIIRKCTGLGEDDIPALS